MNNEIKELAKFLQHEGHCLPLIESTFLDNECYNGTEKCSECNALKTAAEQIAKNLHEAGYRKQSDTVKEFVEKLIEDIEQAIDSNKKVMDKRGYGDSYLTCLGKVTACQGIIDKINELAAQHGVEVEE